MKQIMCSVDYVEEKIRQGKFMMLAGDESVLKNLPPGNWIGGTTPCFMSKDGGVFTQERIGMVEVPDYAVHARIKVYDEKNICRVYENLPENGFGMIILPGLSSILKIFALESVQYKGFAVHPLVGWVTGVSEKKQVPKVFNGQTASPENNLALVLEIGLPDNKAAEVGILNIFEQGDGDVITFDHDAFEVNEAFVNGKPVNFFDYLTSQNTDIRFPMVADYYGVMINTSFRIMDSKNKTVKFYAPVFQDIEYKLARPVNDYQKAFNDQLSEHFKDDKFFACNCILNYLYSSLESIQMPGVVGPITFGEIAYQYLNQTLTYVSINDI